MPTWAPWCVDCWPTGATMQRDLFEGPGRRAWRELGERLGWRAQLALPGTR